MTAFVCLLLGHLAVDGCVTKASDDRECAGPSRVDSAHTGSDRSVLVDAGRVPLSRVLAGPYRHGSPLLERPSTG
ncbi:MAG TPA: hypothetical protein VLL08_24795 [Kineosporiaceae bacterium]|jgi:hypothetical protein|nr:hypothetical protein [Kineosporiaceae bacterium]